MPAQPEIEAYLNFVADRLDLRRDIPFGTKVVAMTFDEDAARLDARHRQRASVRRAVRGRGVGHPVGAAGTRHRRHGYLRGHVAVHQPLAAAGVDLTGKRVGVIGTGSTGVQLIPVVATEAGHLTCSSARRRTRCRGRSAPFEPGELDEMKARLRRDPRGAARSIRSAPPGSAPSR